MKTRSIPLLGLALALLAPGMVHPAAPGVAPELLPPPGLYRIDRDIEAATGATRLDVREDGASGDQLWRRRVPDHVGPDQIVKGKGAVRHCHGGASRDVAAGLLPALAACRQGPTVAEGGAVVHTAACPGATVRSVIRRLGHDSWEIVTQTRTAASQAGEAAAPDARLQRAMLEQAARGAATAQEREAAARRLAALARSQAALQQHAGAAVASARARLEAAAQNARTPEEAAGARAALAALGGPAPLLATVRERWTRLAAHCGAASASGGRMP